LLTELYHPEPDGLIADNDSTVGQEILHVPQAQAEAEIQLDSVFDNFGREAVASEAGGALVFGHGKQLKLR